MICPQLHVAILLCEKMADNQALYFSNFRRYAYYEGFQKSIKFAGPASPGEVRKDFIAIDALNFNLKMSDFGGLKHSPAEQFTPKCILRELNKALIGFTLPEDSRFKAIATGKWGCGVFHGDNHLKFVIQWLASSAAGGHPLIFHSF